MHSLPTDLKSDLAQLLKEIKPNSLLLIGDGLALEASDMPEVQQISAAGSLSALEGLGRFDLVIVLGALNSLDKKHGELLLGSLKNLHAKRLLLSHTPCPDWSLPDFLAFAMSELNHYPADADKPEQQLFEYNIFSYKSVPDWLNNQFWANPKMWDKERW